MGGSLNLPLSPPYTLEKDLGPALVSKIIINDKKKYILATLPFNLEIFMFKISN